LELLNNGETIVSVSTVEVNRKLFSFLKYIDKPLFREKTIALLSLEYLEPKDFISKITTIMNSLQIKVSDRLTSADVFLYPIGSNVIVICKNNDYCKLINEWKNKIDNINSISWNGFYVYIPKNRNASDLVKILQNIRKTKSANFEVILDESRNQIILKGKKSVLAPVIALLKKLDTLPKQVLVETIIAEITLKNELQYGLEWFLQHSGYFNGSLGTLNGLGVGGAGFTYNLVTSTGKFKLIMNMFAKKNLIKILSSPHLVVINGKQASINVGTEVPVISSEVSAADVTTSNNKPSILRNVSYRNTGVQLNIKPFILSKGIVELEVKQTISEAQANNLSSIDSPIILNRSISTDVIVKNGESVVLGGLISSNYSKTVNKVPGLGDIPAIGNLFKSDSTGRTKTELILIITPKILTSANDYVNISNNIINGLREINAMLQNQ
jgi:general secretion pathway protein D